VSATNKSEMSFTQTRRSNAMNDDYILLSLAANVQ